MQRFYSSLRQQIYFCQNTCSPVRLRSERITQKCVARLAPGFVRDRGHILWIANFLTDCSDIDCMHYDKDTHMIFAHCFQFTR